MELQDLIIEYKPNPFNVNWLETADSFGTKTDYSGGMGYYYTVLPAKVEDGTVQYMSGHNVRFSPSPSNWADFYWDFAYFGNVRVTSVPSGTCHITVEERITDGRTTYLLNVSSDGASRVGSVVADFAYDVTNHEITESSESSSNGWKLVLRDADYENVIVDSSGAFIDNGPYYFEGAYKMWSSSSAYADSVIESAEQRGFDEGMREGVATANGNQSAFDLMGSAFSSVGGMLGVAVLPGITLGTLVAVPLIVTLLVVVVRLLKK